MDKATEAKKVKKTLSAQEVKKLAECEKAIQENNQSFFLAGKALLEIRDGKLHKAEFTSFNEYCEGRWGFSGSHARRLIEAYQLVTMLRSEIPGLGEDRLPRNEFQARLFLRLQKEKNWVKSWKALLKVANKRKVEISGALIEKICAKGSAKGGHKKPHPDAKARFAKDEEPDLRRVTEAIGLVSTARMEAEDYSIKDWIKFLDNLESTLESV
jgi:hypothetical protein